MLSLCHAPTQSHRLPEPLFIFFIFFCFPFINLFSLPKGSYALRKLVEFNIFTSYIKILPVWVPPGLCPYTAVTVV